VTRTRTGRTEHAVTFALQLALYPLAGGLVAVDLGPRGSDAGERLGAVRVDGGAQHGWRWVTRPTMPVWVRELLEAAITRALAKRVADGARP
jgi:hypothetical protein